MAADIALARLQLGAAAVLSPTQAAKMLPVREAEAMRWLRERGLVRDTPGLGEVVVWGDVVTAISSSPLPTPARATRGTRARSSLG